MSRSSKKGPYVDPKVYAKVEKQGANATEAIKTWARSCTIVPEFIGQKFEVHNGKAFIPVYITEDMVGHKLGEFSPTRGPLGERVEQNLRRLLDDAEQLLADNRYEVLALAHALERNKTIAGEDVIAIIDGKQGPLFDGTVYYTDEARQALDDYHQFAVDAHRAHGPVSVPLPELPRPA